MNLNKIVAIVLIASLAFLAGKGFDGGGFKLPDFGSVIPSPKLDGDGWLVIVQEADEPLQVAADAARNVDWLSGLESRGVKFRTYDDDQEVAESYVKALGDKVPGALIIDAGGATAEVFAATGLSEADDLESLTEFVDRYVK